MTKLYACLLLGVAACTASPIATPDPDAWPEAQVVIPESLVAPQPNAVESCGESCESSYPIGCNTACPLCGAVPGARHGKCLTALP